MLAITVPALAFADYRRWGRRVSTITGGVIQFMTMFTIGALYASRSVHGDHGAGRWMVIICIYLFAIGFNATWAVTFRIYVSEIQSPETRAGASSLALSANWVGLLTDWFLVTDKTSGGQLGRSIHHSHLPGQITIWCLLSVWRRGIPHCGRVDIFHARNHRQDTGRNPSQLPQNGGDEWQ